jgi:molybdopterin-guanine dinucleotide biosynthesis protein A
MEDDNILAVVLAGGKSERFGVDKSQVKLGNKTLIEHVLIKIEPFFRNKLIVTKNSLKNINSHNAVIINDCIEGHLGPLIGVLSAMKWAEKKLPQINWIITFPCDTPFFDKNIINEFKEKTKLNESLLYFATSRKKRHNIFGLWSLNLLKILENDIIKNNHRKVEVWADKIGMKNINIKNDNFDSFFNINTKSDLMEAEKIFKKKND